jgi:pyruvate dehydrogenase E2 component (dihydrolipoamide acetyltransferase)
MATEVILPKLGQTMEEGVIVEWVKKEGDPVKRGEVLFTVESDKAVLEVEATARGFLRKILVPEGQTVPVLTLVAIITRKADEDISPYEGDGRPVVTRSAETVPDRAAQAPPQPQSVPVPERPMGRIFASPRARKTAREKGVDLALVQGTGPNSRIVERDVLAFAAAQPKATPMALRTAEAMGVDVNTVPGTGVSGRIMKADVVAVEAVPTAAVEAVAPVGVEVPAVAQSAATPPPVDTTAVEQVPMTGMRRIIAQRMSASDAQTARVTLVTEADATAFVEVRAQLKADVSEEWGFTPNYNDLLGLIVARALGEIPYMNARLSEEGVDGGGVIERLPYVNLGMAVDTERGLLVPVIRDADRKGLRAFGTEFRELVERARVGRSLPDDLSGGTFTITNLGMYDVDAFTPIINLPEAAILGVGRIQPKVVALGSEPGEGGEWQTAVCQMWTLSLTFDHRLVDGAPAARFLQRIKQLVENPYLLLS